MKNCSSTLGRDIHVKSIRKEQGKPREKFKYFMELQWEGREGRSRMIDSAYRFKSRYI